jgi:predicted DNA-binding protein
MIRRAYRREYPKMSTQTESIEITGLPPGTKEAIEELSRSRGRSADEYLRMLIETEIALSDLQLKQETESWEAASDEDWLKLERNLAEVP